MRTGQTMFKFFFLISRRLCLLLGIYYMVGIITGTVLLWNPYSLLSVIELTDKEITSKPLPTFSSKFPFNINSNHERLRNQAGELSWNLYYRPARAHDFILNYASDRIYFISDLMTQCMFLRKRASSVEASGRFRFCFSMCSMSQSFSVNWARELRKSRIIKHIFI